jgi:hypothetical protein
MIDISIGGVDYPVPSSAADTNWAAKQVAFEQALATASDNNATNILELENEVAALDNVTWVALPLLSGWSNLGTPAAPAASYLDSFRVAHVRLGVVGGGGTASNPICTLPVGQRPPYDVRVLVNCLDGSGDAEFVIQPTGNIYINPLVGDYSAGGVSMECSFSVVSGP